MEKEKQFIQFLASDPSASDVFDHCKLLGIETLGYGASYVELYKLIVLMAKKIDYETNHNRAIGITPNTPTQPTDNP